MGGRDAGQSLRLPNRGKDTSLWRVTFVGEGGQDLGGLCRESWREAAEDLAGGAGGLFVPSPNVACGGGRREHAESETGSAAETGPENETVTFVPNPAPCAATPESLRMLTFVGQLMGAALRSQQPLALDMPR